MLKMGSGAGADNMGLGVLRKGVSCTLHPEGLQDARLGRSLGWFGGSLRRHVKKLQVAVRQ